MALSSVLDQLHLKARQNKWLYYFSIFLRIALAGGFLPSGLVKIAGERFTALSDFHPMGHYLEALHHTGFYYPFIGVLQVLAAILLLIPRTATLGAIIYFPIILNICVLSIAVRFEGSLITSPLMVLANLYLLFWDYHKFRYIFFRGTNNPETPLAADTKFPLSFFFASAIVVGLLVLLLSISFNIMPRNTIRDCRLQCEGAENEQACMRFCDCIHQKGGHLEDCLKEYEQK